MLIVWITFILLILALLALDLGVFHRKAHIIGLREALLWSAFWVILALAFNVLVYFLYENHWFGIGKEVGHELGGRAAALQFFTAYVLEKSLSVDNIFVIAMIFAYFGVPAMNQHRVLFWGIVGALVMRGIMIAIGVALINRFDWIIYVFGALLVLAAIKMLFTHDQEIHPDRNPLVRLARRLFPVTPDFHGHRFFVRVDGRLVATPLFLVLLVIESTDLLFAVDSIPAVFAVTRDPFLVFTSNVFAILGLRALYFALAGLIRKFRYLQLSLVVLLVFVGVKMIVGHALEEEGFHIPTWFSLAGITAVLGVGIGASIVSTYRHHAVAIANETWRHTRRVLVFCVGSAVLLVGLSLIVLPGPAFLVIPLGLIILATEFQWPRKYLNGLRRRLVGHADPASRHRWRRWLARVLPEYREDGAISRFPEPDAPPETPEEGKMSG